MRGNNVAEPWSPSPAEIIRGCAEIRAGWSQDEERARRVVGFRRQEWAIPGVDRNREIVDRETVAGFMGEW